MKKIGVLIEEHFDGDEYIRFNEFFSKKGYAIDYLSHLWNQKSLKFGSNPKNGKIEQNVEVKIELNQVDPSNYKGIILIGAYAMDRLRYESHPKKNQPNQAPAVQFLRKMVASQSLKIGTICHALWLFCADPTLLKGKKVTCAHNIICDVQNAGGEVQYDKEGVKNVVVDGNLISAKHPEVIEEFMNTFLEEMER